MVFRSHYIYLFPFQIDYRFHLGKELGLKIVFPQKLYRPIYYPQYEE